MALAGKQRHAHSYRKVHSRRKKHGEDGGGGVKTSRPRDPPTSSHAF